MKTLSHVDRGSNPGTIGDAIERAFRTGEFDTVPPPRDPKAVYFQVAILVGRRLVSRFWSSECDVIPNFEHWGRSGYFMATGAGGYFEAHVCRDAIAFCVGCIDSQGDHGDLTALAEWTRANTKPGGGICWRNPKFQLPPARR